MTARPGRSFRLGAMRDRITVVVEVTDQDEAGQPVVTHRDWLVDEPASYEDVSGGETARGRQVEASVTAIFTVRYRPGYETTHAVKYDGHTYGVVQVVKVQGQDRYRELMCKAVK
jgi:SPP1 family predicted phage head-tail adaptor